MIPNEEKEEWHCLAVKHSSELSRGITSKHHGDFYCLNCLHSFKTEDKLRSHEKVCKNKYFCGIVMPLEKNNMLEFKHYMKSDKMPYKYLCRHESLMQKIDGCENNPEKHSATKIWEHIPSGCAMPTILGFEHIEDKNTLYCGKDFMKRFCETLRES